VLFAGSVAWSVSTEGDNTTWYNRTPIPQVILVIDVYTCMIHLYAYDSPVLPAAETHTYGLCSLPATVLL